MAAQHLVNILLVCTSQILLFLWIAKQLQACKTKANDISITEAMRKHFVGKSFWKQKQSNQDPCNIFSICLPFSQTRKEHFCCVCAWPCNSLGPHWTNSKHGCTLNLVQQIVQKNLQQHQINLLIILSHKVPHNVGLQQLLQMQCWAFPCLLLFLRCYFLDTFCDPSWISMLLTCHRRCSQCIESSWKWQTIVLQLMHFRHESSRMFFEMIDKTNTFL